MAAMTDEQKKKVTDQMASRFFAPVSRPAPGPSRERATSAGRATAPTGRTRDPVLDQIAASLLASPVVSRDRNLTNAQNAQLTRDSIIKTARQNQEIAGKLLERDIANQGSYDVQRLQNQGDLETTGMREQGATRRTAMSEEGATGRTAMSEEGATGRVQMQEKGLADRLLKGHQQGLETLGEQNKYNREAANRDLVKTLLASGAQGDVRMNQLYNQGGAFNADLSGLAVPKETADYGFTKLTGGVDEQGRLLPDQLIRTNKSTGQAEYAPLADAMLGGQAVAAEGTGAQQPGYTEQDVLFAENTLGKNFDPYNANPEQKQYLRNLMSVNRPLFDYLMNRYAAGRAD